MMLDTGILQHVNPPVIFFFFFFFFFLGLFVYSYFLGYEGYLCWYLYIISGET